MAELKIGGDASGAEKALADLGTQLEKLAKNVQQQQRQLDQAFSQVGRALDGATSKLLRYGSILGGVAAGGGLAVLARQAAEFQSQIAYVNTLLTASDPPIQKFRQGLLDIAATSTKSATDLSRGLYQALSSGIPATLGAGGALDLLNQAQRAAAAGGATTEQAVLALTRVYNTYGAAAGTASEVSDKLFQIVKDGVIEFPDLAKGIGEVSGVASKFGVSFDQVGAAIAQVSRVLPKEETFTAVRNAIVQLGAPAPEAAEKARQLGIELGSAALRSKGLAGVLADVIDKTGGSEEAIRQILPEVTALPALFQIASNGGADFAEQLGRISQASGTTQDALDKQKDTFDSLLAKLRNAVEIKANEAFDLIAASAGNALKEFTDFVKAINSEELAQGLNTLGSVLGGIVKILEKMVELTGAFGRGLNKATNLIEDQLRLIADPAERAIEAAGGRASHRGTGTPEQAIQRKILAERRAAREQDLKDDQAAAKKAAAEQERIELSETKGRDAANKLRHKKEAEGLKDSLDLLGDFNKARVDEYEAAEAEVLRDAELAGEEEIRIAKKAKEDYLRGQEELGKKVQGELDKLIEAEQHAGEERLKAARDGLKAQVDIFGKLIRGDIGGAITASLTELRDIAIQNLDETTALLAEAGLAALDGLSALSDLVGQGINLAGAAGKFTDEEDARLRELQGKRDSTNFAVRLEPGEAEELAALEARKRSPGAAALQAEVDRAKGFIEAVAANFPDLIKQVTPAIRELGPILAKAMPEVARALAREAPNIVRAVIDQIPLLIDALIASIPDLLRGFADSIPVLIEGIIGHVVPKLPELFAAIAGGLAAAFANPAFITGIAESFARGIQEAVSQLTGGLLGGKDSGTFGLDLVPDEIPIVGGLFARGGKIERGMAEAVARQVRSYAHGGPALSSLQLLASRVRDSEGRSGEPAILHPGERVLTAGTTTEIEALLRQAVRQFAQPPQASVVFRSGGARTDRALRELVGSSVVAAVNAGGGRRVHSPQALARPPFPGFPAPRGSLGR